MSLKNLPSKVEVMGWNSRKLAEYMGKLELRGCDQVVMEYSINGEKFMQMSEDNLHIFPSCYVPIISKIQRDININKGEKRSIFGHQSKAQKCPQQTIAHEDEFWDEDEFDNDSDYERSLGRDTEHNHISTEQQVYEQEDSDEDKVIPPPRPSLGKGHYSGNKEGGSVKAPDPSTGQVFQSNTHMSTYKSVHLFSKQKQPPAPSPRKHQAVADNFIPGPREGLDPSWYRGNVSRHEAEVALREVNKDGAFVVRDSSKGSDEHPYTLMVLKQGKVYNVQIRNQQNSYSLGTGLNNNRSFPGVEEMITHYTQVPLLLIDATHHSSEARSMCCLTYPAGF